MEENQTTNEYPILSAPYDEEGFLSELDRALDYLNKNSKDIDKLVDGEHGYKAIKGIFYVVSTILFKEIRENDLLIEKYNGFEIFSKILNYLTQKLDELNFNDCRPNYRWLPNDYNPTLNERRIFILTDTIAIINHLIPSSMKLRLYFLDKKRLKYFNSLIVNKNILENSVKYDFALIKSTIFDINWLSKSAENNKSDWKNLRFIQNLIDSFKSYKSTEKLKLYIYMAIANIADDKEIEDFSEIQTSIDTFVGLANQTANDIQNGIVQRSKQQFPDEDDNQKVLVYDVAYILDSSINATITITGILLAIYRLSINPKSKLNIYNKLNFKQSLKCILNYGNEIEKFYSIQVIAQLAFNNEVLNDIKSDEELCALIKEISTNNEIKIEKLKKICKQILWSIEENKTKLADEKISKTTTNDILMDEGHIMISYNTASRDLCLRIKEELEKDNHKVWIDVSEIHGSSLDSMAKAVEQAKIILMCVTEKYRQSLNCQAEAQYSFRLKKNIIPCIMQKGYHNVDGWLGFIIGDKIFIDFSKYEFEDSVNRLKNQITRIIADSKGLAPVRKEFTREVPQIQASIPPLPRIEKNSENELDTKVVKIIIKNEPKKSNENEIQEKINNWNESEVEEWFKSINLTQSSIFTSLCPCKGELLTQMHQIQLHAPEFFFKAVSTSSSNMSDLKHVATFSLELKKLFSN